MTNLIDSIENCQHEIDYLTEELQERNDAKSVFTSQKKIIESFLSVEEKLGEYVAGNIDVVDDILPYLEMHQSEKFSEIVEDFNPHIFNFTIPNIRELKSSPKCSEGVSFNNLILGIQAQYKLFDSEPYLGLYLKVKSDSDEFDDSAELDSTLKFTVTLENSHPSKNISQHSQQNFSHSKSFCGFDGFCSWSQLLSPKNGWLTHGSDIAVSVEVFELE